MCLIILFLFFFLSSSHWQENVILSSSWDTSKRYILHSCHQSPKKVLQGVKSVNVLCSPGLYRILEPRSEKNVPMVWHYSRIWTMLGRKVNLEVCYRERYRNGTKETIYPKFIYSFKFIEVAMWRARASKNNMPNAPVMPGWMWIRMHERRFLSASSTETMTSLRFFSQFLTFKQEPSFIHKILSSLHASGSQREA